jgi:hypothetical protein
LSFFKSIVGIPSSLLSFKSLLWSLGSLLFSFIFSVYCHYLGLNSGSSVNFLERCTTTWAMSCLFCYIWDRVFLRTTQAHPRNLTGGDRGAGKTYDRQTDRKWGQVCQVLGWRRATLIASYLYLYSLRPYSLQFFFFKFIYSHVHTLFGSFLPLFPSPT